MLGHWQDQNMPKEMQQHVDNLGTQPPQMYNVPVEGINKKHSIYWSNGQQSINETSNKPNTVSDQWHNQNYEAASHHQSAHLVQTNNVNDTFSSWPQPGNVMTATPNWRYSNMQSESVHPNQQLQQQIDNNLLKDNMSHDNNDTRFAANEWQQTQAAPTYAFGYTIHSVENKSQRNWQNHTDMLGQDQNMPKEIQQQVDNMGNQCTQSPQMYNTSVEGINKKHSINWSNGQQSINEMSNKPSTMSNQWHNQNCEATMSHHQPSQLVQTNNLNDTFSSWPQSGNITTASHDWRYSNMQSESVHPNQWLQQQVDNNSFKDNMSQDNNGTRLVANEWQMQLAPFSYAPVTTTVPTTVESIVHTLNNNEQQENEKQVTITSSYESLNLVKSSDIKPMIGNHNLNSAIDNGPKSDISKNVLGENNDRVFVPTVTEELSSNFGQLNLGNKSRKHTDYSDESLDVYLNPVEGKVQHSATNFNVGSRSNPDNISVLPSDYVSSSMDRPSTHSTDNQPPMSQDHPIPNTYHNVTKMTDSISQSGYDQWYNQSTLQNAWYAKDHSRLPTKQRSAPEQNVENYENIQQTSDFINVEIVVPTTLHERDIYGSRDSINKEMLDNDPKPKASPKESVTNVRGFREEMNNVEVLSMQQQVRPHPPLQTEQMPDNYEFASNDRNTFLETGELTDSHQEHEPTPPTQDDENDEVPNDIPFLREVPGQSSTIDPRRNDPTGQENHGQRISDPRRNDPSGQEQSIQIRNISDRVERRDVLPGQERNVPQLLRGDSDTLERRNDPSGRERSLPPQQSRNDPSGEERYQPQSQIMMEPSETREVLGRGNEPDEVARQIQDAELRQIPGGASSNDVTQLIPDDRTAATTGGRVVTGSLPEILSSTIPQDPTSGDARSKREEAVGASLESETNQGVSASSNRRNSYEDQEEDAGSRESRDESRERRRESSPDRRRYEYDRKNAYYDHDREYEDDYYYDRRRAGDTDRPYNVARDDFKRRDIPYRDDDRKHHSRDDLDRYAREDMDRRVRGKEDLDERDGRRRPQDDRRREDPRRRDRDPRDYDARYSRDPRDKDYIDRERRRPRRYDHDYDIRDPYRRDYYDDLYGRSSRPSSRSSYNDKDREYYARTKDPYYAYNMNARYGGYDYGALYGNNYYAYLENLRQTNPAAYTEWYHKYYGSHQQQQQHIARGVGNYPEDRASVHSGRSSCDDRNTSDKRTLGVTHLEDSTIISARLTPTKYSTSHAYGCFSIGSLVHVHPSYPADGERAKVDIFRVDNLLSHDPVTRDLRSYPGPLINGVTHKKTIIEYCENKIKKAVMNEEIVDRASYILLYELMIMLIQQNGNVVGVDIAGLLLRNKDTYPHDTSKLKFQDVKRRESQVSQRSGATGSDGSTQDISALSEKPEAKQRKTTEQITDEFRDTLLYGRVQEALEYAMNEGLWGHALFLASKLDKRTYASVMTRFANSLPSHDPLQTLYQLHSGRVPAVVTCVADPRWDDWRPHLAMIISNTSTNPEINRRSITTLGDTLFAKGDIHAAHFCYILAQIDFGAYGVNGVKLVLIGANPNKPYSEFLTMEAIMLTEIYEYARNLSDPCFTLVDLQTFKFDLIVKMVDCGLIEKALLYIEQIATNIANDSSKYKKSFIESVYILGDRIKYHDPIYKDATEDATNLTWLNKLAEIIGKYQSEETSEEETYASHTIVENQKIQKEMKQQQSSSQQQWNTIQPDYGDGPISMMEVNTSEMQSNWQPLSLPANIQDTYDPNTQYMRNMDESTQQQQPQQQDYWNQQSYYQGNYGRNESTLSNWPQQSMPGMIADQTEINNTQQLDKWNFETEREDKTPTPESNMQPAISMTPSTGKQYDPLEELDALETPRASGKSPTEMKKTTEKTAEKKPTNSGGSWFGGLFSKLAPKPKNQMILPDDSNPTIVWDPVAKKWMNKDEDGDGGASALVPPPKTSDVSFRAPVMERNTCSQPLPPSGEDASAMDAISKLPTGNSNMYKLPKGRSMRANYVDVMNPGGGKLKAPGMTSSTPMTSPLVPMATSSPQLFVPAPINDSTAPVDFLTPAATPPSGNVADNTSRWSSTSSLSREVQSYTMRDPRLLQRNKGPMMFNPSEMKDRSVKNMPPSRYPPR
ncbi:protein transport protein Sec16A isoform X4 [Cataglyphis hispanica]|uniref:protein transport protein Sec16A isoform X4 n=1 Tax=Cataglyphis hispanica TaxID=1086592 RepID=UPI0021804F7F|nr:protein transport protein Sec16A isoform X4 [Cataglyphis hispanica]